MSKNLKQIVEAIRELVEPSYGQKVISLTAATLTVSPSLHAGKVISLDIVGTQTLTLPAAAGTGNAYKIYCSVTATGDKVIQVASASDTIGGMALIATDSGGLMFPGDGTDDTITLNGTTSGGVAGSWLELIDVGVGKWAASIFAPATGDEVTPFSAAVS